MTEKENTVLDLEFPNPDEIKETGYYEVKRTINGKIDYIQVLFWSNEDIAIAEENDKIIEQQKKLSLSANPQ